MNEYYYDQTCGCCENENHGNLSPACTNCKCLNKKTKTSSNEYDREDDDNA